MSILLEDLSPHGTLKAIVEDDGRAVYFYLWAGGDHYFGMRACWVCNRRPAPSTMDREAMEKGAAPMLERDACAHPDGMDAPRALRVTWFEEGDGAALSDEKGLLCVIPGWSGLNNFHGYARECTQRNPLCWPLPSDDRLARRIERADAFWKAWDGNAAWPAFKRTLGDALRAQLGEPMNEVDISLDTFPPRVVQHFRRDNRFIAVTIGMSIRRQPRVEMAMEDPRNAVRIELAARVQDETQLAAVTSWMRGTSGMPWNQFTWLGNGQSLPSSAIAGFPFMLLAKDAPDVPRITLPDDTDAPRSVLWLVPITAEQREAIERARSG